MPSGVRNDRPIELVSRSVRTLCSLRLRFCIWCVCFYRGDASENQRLRRENRKLNGATNFEILQCSGSHRPRVPSPLSLTETLFRKLAEFNGAVLGPEAIYIAVCTRRNERDVTAFLGWDY